MTIFIDLYETYVLGLLEVFIITISLNYTLAVIEDNLKKY